MMPTFFLGGTYVLLRQFDAEQTIAAIERERVTHVMLVPAQIVAMLGAQGFESKRLASLEGRDAAAGSDRPDFPHLYDERVSQTSEQP